MTDSDMFIPTYITKFGCALNQKKCQWNHIAFGIDTAKNVSARTPSFSDFDVRLEVNLLYEFIFDHYSMDSCCTKYVLLPVRTILMEYVYLPNSLLAILFISLGFIINFITDTTITNVITPKKLHSTESEIIFLAINCIFRTSDISDETSVVLNKEVRGVLQSLRVNNRLVPVIRLPPLSYTDFPIQYFCITSPFDATRPEILTAT
jgi:hypothetical protein